MEIDRILVFFILCNL